jgi:HK97 family phage portal protein
MKMMTRLKSWFSAGGESVDTKSSESFGIDVLGKFSSLFITESKAMKIEAFYSCVRDKAETIGQLPIKLYKTSRNARELVLQGRNHRIFTQRPCDYLTMQQFLEMAIACYETNGVFYAYLARNDRGEVMEVIPFANQRNVCPMMDVNGVVYYTYSTNDGKPVIAAYPEDLFIISMFTTDGYRPVRPIEACAQLLNIANAQDDAYESLQTNGITSQMALKTEQVFNNPGAQERLREEMKKMRGAKGADFIPVFEQGLTPISLRLTPKDAELLGNKEFTLNRICRMTRVPPHRTGIASDPGTKSTVAELDEAYMRDSLNPILVKLEYAFNALLPDGMRIEFNRKSFYAGSPWRLVEAVEREVKGGLASINEGRIDLGRETIEGGDVFAIDNNNVTYGLWTDIKEIQAQLYGQANNQNNEGNTDDSKK